MAVNRHYVMTKVINYRWYSVANREGKGEDTMPRALLPQGHEYFTYITGFSNRGRGKVARKVLCDELRKLQILLNDNGEAGGGVKEGYGT